MPESFNQKDNGKENNPKKPLLSRRDLLRGAGGVVATTAITGVTLPSGVDRAQEILRPETIKKEIIKKLDLLESIYHIVIYGTFFDSQDGSANMLKKVNQLMHITYNEASLMKISRALDYIEKELSKYPIGFVTSLHISSIHIVDSLIAKADESTIGTTSTSKSKLNPDSIITLEISSGILDKDKNFGWSEKEPFNHALHHELFHAIFNRVYYMSIGSLSIKWLSLYDKEDYVMEPTKDKSGFITVYGQTAPKEDFSETASAMMNNSESIFEKITKDPKLKKKVDFLKKLLFAKSFGLCNEEYWDLLRKGDSVTEFFKKRKDYLLSLNPGQFSKELESNHLQPPDLIDFGEESLTTKEEVSELFRKNLLDFAV